MKNKHKSLLMKIAILTGVVIIPLAYSLFYLGAFQDPYGKMTELPVAIVNNDSGAVINGEQRNLGNEFTEKLSEGKELKWTVTNSSDAENGLNGTDYYAVITIPKDFSLSIANSDVNDKDAQITYSANEKRNYLSAQILNNAVLRIENELTTQIDSEITGQLVNKLNEIPGQLETLDSGLAEISNGTAKLTDGIGELSGGQTNLSSGINQLYIGLSKLYDGSQLLTENLHVFQQGLSQTKDSVVNAISKTEGSADSTAITDGINQLVNGAGQISDGLIQASNGSSQLLSAASSQTSGIPALVGGIDQVNSGTEALNTNLNKYIDSVDSLINNDSDMLKQLTAIYASTSMTDEQKVAAVGKLLSNVDSADNQTKINTLSQSGTALRKGSATVAAGVSQLKNADSSLGDITSRLSQLDSSLKQLSSGSAQLSSGINTLKDEAVSIAGLSDGLKSLAAALDQLDTGATQLYNGAQNLTNGIGTSKTGTKQLIDGSNSLTDGTKHLKDGADSLAQGIKTVIDSVGTATEAARSEISTTDNLVDFSTKPVSITNNPVNPVSDYGTAFAPYFISLSLYVGAVIMFVGIYLDADEKIKILSRSSNRKYVRVGVFAAIGVVQAIALAVIVQFGLGIKPANAIVFYLSCILISMVFIAIVQFFMVCLKDTGKFLTLLLLILQLTSCGGTFPMELVPKFFNVLYPFMPMTYSVRLLKETISGYNPTNAINAALILAAIGIGFTVVTMLLTAGKRIHNERTSSISA
jgi:YhgE/Pip N-terminal domain/YhgE/Pip C-terminal domain